MYAKLNVQSNYINELGTDIIGASYYLCDADDDADISILPTTGIGIGSRALVIPTGHIYMLGPSRKWILYKGVSIMN